MMMATTLDTPSTRDQLSQAIVDVVGAWSDPHRRLFTLVHYAGNRVENAAQAAGMDVVEAARVLEQCERRLRAALRDFRRDDCLDRREAAALKTH